MHEQGKHSLRIQYIQGKPPPKHEIQTQSLREQYRSITTLSLFLGCQSIPLANNKTLLKDEVCYKLYSSNNIVVTPI